MAKVDISKIKVGDRVDISNEDNRLAVFGCARQAGQ
jgi:hypothetical protein